MDDDYKPSFDKRWEPFKDIESAVKAQNVRAAKDTWIKLVVHNVHKGPSFKKTKAKPKTKPRKERH